MVSLISNLFYFFLACLLFVFVSVSSLEFYYEKPGPSDVKKLLTISRGPVSYTHLTLPTKA